MHIINEELSASAVVSNILVVAVLFKVKITTNLAEIYFDTQHLTITHTRHYQQSLP